MRTYTITSQQLREITEAVMIARFYTEAYPSDVKHDDDNLTIDQAYKALLEVNQQLETIK